MRRKVSVLDYLEENCINIPDKISVSCEDDRITWSELWMRSRELGNGIRKILGSVSKKTPIVIFMDKSIRHVVSIYGTLYSGNFYVPLDISTPIDRLNSIFNTLGEYRVLTSRDESSILEEAGYKGEYLVYEDLLEEYAGTYRSAETDAVMNSIIDNDIMYVIFTSGSTGIPKGVAVRHRSVMDYIDSYMDEVGMLPDDICGNQAPFYADMSLRDLYMTLAAGAELCIIPTKYFTFPVKLLQYMDEKKISYCMWVPTVYRIVAQFKALSKLRPSHLRTLCFSGETMPVSVYKYWEESYPDIDFWQFYGPSEITGSCCSYKVINGKEYDDVIPIGRAYRNTGIALLDGEEIIPESDTGHKGEICVYGTCLAAGYYNNDEKTKESFVELPSELGYDGKMYRTGDMAYYDKDGVLVFSGRIDYQVKHMGKRVELGEIEAAAGSLDDVEACVCVHNKKRDALILFYMGKGEAKDIMNALDTKLPPYMIPAAVNRVESFPQLPNGKLNRKLLEEQENSDK